MKKLLFLFLIFSCTTKNPILKSQKKSDQPMSSIHKNILSIIEFQKKMGYFMPSIINPPATDSVIKKTEDKLGMKMNDELKELYKTINGINLPPNTPSGLTGIIPIHDLLDLDGAVEYYNTMDWEMHWEMYEEAFDTTYGIGNNLFPFIHDGAGNCYWVDLNEGTKNYSRLYWTNTFGDEPDYLFNSLTDFFEGIHQGYEMGVFSLDKERYLDCDYKKWGEICHNLDPSIKYWKEYTSSSRN